MKPCFAHEDFAADVQRQIDEVGLSYRAIAARVPMLNPAMLSRACHGQALSVESFLALCRAFELDPLSYLKNIQNHAVTANEKRETSVMT